MMDSPNRAAPLLEVIVCSVVDAIEAERGGANRLEIIRDFDRGGLTPSMELVQDILAHVMLPLRVMLRDTEAYEVRDKVRVENLCAAARAFARLPIEGLVLGFLWEGDLDLTLTRRILSCSPNLKATFHHAFEEVPDPFDTIERLKTCGQIDHILTHGGPGGWPEKIARLKRYAQAASPEIEILAGGGMNVHVIESIAATSSIREFHAGRAARSPAHATGVVRAGLVRKLRQATEQHRIGQE